MLIDGEKWACEACIRGHRVSSCQHSDRPLSHINRKGRPMSQCPHCRGLRKARANHVKCECGTKPHSKNNCPKQASGTNTQNNAARKQCCCSHGTSCTCSAKRDSKLATVPETPSSGVSKRLPPTTKTPQPNVFRSELTGLAQRHKPRRERHAGHPYSIPRSHTAQSSSELRHSVERLTIPDGGASPAYSYQEGGTSTPPLVQRRAVSEHGSPVPDFDNVGAHLPALDIPYPPMGAASLSPSPLEYHPPRSLASSYGSDVDGLWDSGNMSLPPVDWSTFDLGAYGSDTMTNSVSHAGSFASFDYSNHYDHVTRSSSGVTSEPGDLSPVAGMHLHHEFPDKDSYPLSSSAPSLDVNRPHMVASPGVLGPMEHYPQDTEAGVLPSLPAPSLVISHEPESYYSPVPLTVHQQPPYTAAMDGRVGGVPTTSSTDQPLVTHGPMTTTAISEPAWLPTSYPTTTAGPSPLQMANSGFMYSGQWSQ